MSALDTKNLSLDQAHSRVCTQCHSSKPPADFYIANSRTGKRVAACKDCTKQATLSRYYEHRDVVLEQRRAEWPERSRKRSAASNARQKAWGSKYDSRKAWLAELKRNPCMDCNQTLPIECMDLDHVRGTKLSNVSVLRTQAVSDDVLHDEIMKCDLVCANCHRIRTSNRRNKPKKDLH